MTLLVDAPTLIAGEELAEIDTVRGADVVCISHEWQPWGKYHLY
jgi:hypothetical protein